MDFDEWVKYGIDKRWCGPAICETHDGLPMSESEYDSLLETDTCIHILRLYPDPETADEIEKTHAPSNWRKQS